MGAFFIGGQVYEYTTLVQRGPDDLVVAVRLGLLPHHRLPRPARDRRPHRLPVRPRPHLRGPAGSPTTRRPAPSSSRTTGTSSTSSGSACSRPSTSQVTGSAVTLTCHRAPLRAPARRRHPVAGLVVLLFGLVAVALGVRRVRPDNAVADSSATATTQQIEEGTQALPRRLLLLPRPQRRGRHQRGQAAGPSLIGVGAAAVDFQVGTGRMPLAQTGVAGPAQEAGPTPRRRSRRSRPTSPRWPRARRSRRRGVVRRQHGDAEQSRGRGAVPHQLRVLPQLRRSRRRAARRQVRAVADGRRRRSTSTRRCSPARRTCRSSPTSVLTPRGQARHHRVHRQSLQTARSPGGLRPRPARPGHRGSVRLDRRARRCWSRRRLDRGEGRQGQASEGRISHDENLPAVGGRRSTAGSAVAEPIADPGMPAAPAPDRPTSTRGPPSGPSARSSICSPWPPCSRSCSCVAYFAIPTATSRIVFGPAVWRRQQPAARPDAWGSRCS